MDADSGLVDAVATVHDVFGVAALPLAALHGSGNTFAGFMKSTLADVEALVARARRGAGSALWSAQSSAVASLWVRAAAAWEVTPRAAEQW